MRPQESTVTWVTDQLAVGPAPASKAAMQRLHKEGITGIINLCREFLDLHEIEEKEGFEVYYLPITDEEAPDLVELEKALAWLDEALYLGKKVYIHCRFGMGRTGTVLNAYLLRRGLGHKLANRRLKKLRSKPANFAQWRTIRKYGKETGELTVREPCLEFKRAVDLSPMVQDYQKLLAEVEQYAADHGLTEQCGRDHDRCCHSPKELCLMEAVTVSMARNRELSSQKREEIIGRAVEAAGIERSARRRLRDVDAVLSDVGTICPLLEDGRCLLFDSRPVSCRVFGMEEHAAEAFWEEFEPRLGTLSENIYLALTSELLDEHPMFSLPDVASGKYVERFFSFMMRKMGCARQ
ncbi:protein-tyrosine phosphatase family protein [Salidesulfovibrio onnuriiensis]|uniref:protein-tyrosine phosphatase family protein n=1 Tax=Salidesulfovibrio onnuriiensis TaxID=2583823 RepID=UPI0011C8F71C|nr:dual specificity protein phosphatase family protein [Salidesulfovibrio onnuriiensis]